MLRAVLIETHNLDEPTLRQRIEALAGAREWRLEAQGEGWLLWLDDSGDSARLCGVLLACNWLRRLDFVA